MQNLMNDLMKLFQKDERIFADGKLLKNKLTELALKLDQPLIELLLSDSKAKEHFFIEKTAKKERVLVFDKDKLIAFVNNKEFLPDSFTSFKNKIGLMANGDYLKEKGDVVLAWAYKDCVLEGGQDKEDQKRDEIFYNETLSPDEIDRLFEPKVLTNFKKYDSEGEHRVTEFNPDDNLIIKGNNLLALHCLKTKYRGQIKLIYIDVPFNKDAEVFYNDKFKHSSWLTFMKNRLEIALELLEIGGAIFVHLDDTEFAYLKVLLDEVLGRANYRNHIILTTNKPFGFKATSDKLFKQAQHILFYCKDSSHFGGIKKLYRETDYDDSYNLVFDDIKKPEKQWTWRNIQDSVAVSLGFNSVQDAIKKLSKKVFKDEIARYALENTDRVFQTAAVSGGAYLKRKTTISFSMKHPNKIIRHPNDDMDYMFINGRRVIFYKERIITINGVSCPGELITDIWSDISFEGLSHEGGVNFAKSKKPEKLIKRIIDLTGVKQDEYIMDFFLGSGTTAAVAHKMGINYIGIEQINYEEEDSVSRLKHVISGDRSGISKEVPWTGGGSFIYAELMEWNEKYMTEIQKADISRKLLNIYEKMKTEAFFRYDIDLSKFEEKEFEKLSLKEQKQVLCECLDKNHLYVNLSEIDDATYKVSAEDKKLNREFYKTVV